MYGSGLLCIRTSTHVVYKRVRVYIGNSRSRQSIIYITRHTPCGASADREVEVLIVAGDVSPFARIRAKTHVYTHIVCRHVRVYAGKQLLTPTNRSVSTWSDFQNRE